MRKGGGGRKEGNFLPSTLAQTEKVFGQIEYRHLFLFFSYTVFQLQGLGPNGPAVGHKKLLFVFTSSTW